MYIFDALYNNTRGKTLIGRERLQTLYTNAVKCLDVEGEFWECGVYKGGSAYIFARLIEGKQNKILRLFDTFSGMPQTNPDYDKIDAGMFSDTDLNTVIHFINSKQCIYHKGFIPDTFKDLDTCKIALAHIDTDIYQSVYDCFSFIWPRLNKGGVIMLDDYENSLCPGCKIATDIYLKDKQHDIKVIHEGQAIITHT